MKTKHILGSVLAEHTRQHLLAFNLWAVSVINFLFFSYSVLLISSANNKIRLLLKNMKFTVQPVASSSPNCKMRIGRLSEINRLPNSVFLTPLLLFYSKGGSVAHLTREVLEMVSNISSLAVQVPLANSVQCYCGVKNFEEGISSFAGIPECLTYCSVQDPGEETKSGYNKRNSITVWTHMGRNQLTPDKYMDMIEAFRPDMYHVLCDGDTNLESSRKRAQKAVDVSTRMFVTCAERHAKSQRLKHSALLAVLEGGYDLTARQDAAMTFSRHPQVQGFVIDGLHNNGKAVEQISYDTIRPVITETLSLLPEEKMRVIHGGWRPDVVLELVKAGVDVFDSSLVYLATERGCGLTFTYKIFPGQEISDSAVTNGCHLSEAEDNLSPSKKAVKKSCKKLNNNYEINLTDKMYFEDLGPVCRGCRCLTCSKHSRAYIHHLLNTKEMLASVLLMIHNLHHYDQFFCAIRESGKKGQYLTIDPPLS